jgi:hypothetical protein
MRRTLPLINFLAGCGKTAEIDKIRNSHYAEFDMDRPQHAY